MNLQQLAKIALQTKDIKLAKYVYSVHVLLKHEVKELPEKKQIELVTRKPEDIGYLLNPTEKVKWLALKSDVNSILYIKNPSEEMIMYAVGEKEDLLKLLRWDKVKISDKVWMIALKKDPFLISGLINPSEELQLLAINIDPRSIKSIKKPTERVLTETLKRDPKSIQYFSSPKEWLQLLAVSVDPSVIQYIKNPTEKTQLSVVESNPQLVKFIYRPTLRVKKLVLKNEPRLIKYFNKIEK